MQAYCHICMDVGIVALYILSFKHYVIALIWITHEVIICDTSMPLVSDLL